MADFKVTELDADIDFSKLAYWDVVIIGAGPGGLAASLTTGLAAGMMNGVRSVVPAIGAAVIAAVLYPMFSAILFPDAQVQQEVPNILGSRLLWTTLTAGIMAVAIGRTILKHDH